MALTEEHIDWELDHYSEIDKFASKSYSQIHGISEALNLGNVEDIDCSEIGEIDLVTFGFPCTDLSVAGKAEGFTDNEGNKTRSGLFFDAARVIEKVKPKFAIFENVKNLVGKKFTNEFNTVLNTLDKEGYHTYWQILNAKDFGVPQNRERVFGISIRKDIDKGFTFPEGFPLTIRLKDILENKVDEKYYLNDEYMKRFKQSNLEIGTDDGGIHIIGSTVGNGKGTNCRHWVHDTEGIVGALSATDYKQPKQILEPRIIQVGSVYLGNNESNNRVYSEEGLSPTLNTMQGGHRQPKILKDGKLRKLTPKECWRLQGFSDKYFDKVEGISNSQLYKQAGNSIAVPVLRAIFVKLVEQYPNSYKKKE